MLLRCILLTFLSCIFCFSTFANDECPVGYGYKITQGIGGCVDLGTLRWYRSSSASNIFYTEVTDLVRQSGANVFINGYQSSKKGFSLLPGECSHAYSAQDNNKYNAIIIRDGRYSDSTVEDVQQAMSGVILYYQRATDPYWTPPRDDTVCNFDTSSYEPYGEYILPAIGECTLCPPNTYKDFVGNEPCTPCPNGLLSATGATSIDQCGHVLHVDDYIVFMPVGRRTEHGLCTMFDGKKYCADVYERE